MGYKYSFPTYSPTDNYPRAKKWSEHRLAFAMPHVGFRRPGVPFLGIVTTRILFVADYDESYLF